MVTFMDFCYVSRDYYKAQVGLKIKVRYDSSKTVGRHTRIRGNMCVT